MKGNRAREDVADFYFDVEQKTTIAYYCQYYAVLYYAVLYSTARCYLLYYAILLRGDKS